MYTIYCVEDNYCYYYRDNIFHFPYHSLDQNGISLVDLSGKDRYPPNPVQIFEQAFSQYRK